MTSHEADDTDVTPEYAAWVRAERLDLLKRAHARAVTEDIRWRIRQFKAAVIDVALCTVLDRTHVALDAAARYLSE